MRASVSPTGTVAMAASLLVVAWLGFSPGWTAVDASTAANAPPSLHRRLTEETMNPNLLKMDYAVRGTVVIAADKISEALQAESNVNNRSFDKIIYTNIGNPQSVGQQPLTWPRQVLALLDLPDAVGIDHPSAHQIFPLDAIRRAREIKIGLGGHGSGAYSHSKGARVFRDDVVSFLRQRDGPEVPTDAENIFLSNGASASISYLLTSLISDSKCGVMIPTPQYPIYSATIDLLGGKKVGYFLDEKNKWNLNIKELERSLKEASDDGTKVVALALINPGNPTGAVLSKEAVRDIVRFCSEHNLVLLADEVYQENVYDEDTEFYSCKRAAYDLGFLEDGLEMIELASFHSTSKGVFGECGRRGGYMELTGFDQSAINQLYKLASVGLCSSVNGQCMTALMCRGPKPGDESYENHEAEKAAIFNSLKRRSKIVEEGLDSIPGFSCQPAQGSMYCFPSVELPQKAIDEALEKGTTPDTLYALSLLESTGICVVPASGFGQEPGRYGFRTTFLPSEEDMANSVKAIKVHHEEFCARYR
jgi:aspartate/methionine/tyrosine aminotransferase